MTHEQQKAVLAAIEALEDLLPGFKDDFPSDSDMRGFAAIRQLYALITTDALESDRRRVRAEALREFAAKWRASASDGNWLLEMEAEAERIAKEASDGV